MRWNTSAIPLRMMFASRWRASCTLHPGARAKEANLEQQELIDNFPDVVALTLGIDIDMVLQQDPIDWTSRSEVAIMV